MKKYEGKSKTKITNMIRKEWMTDRQKWKAIQKHVKRVQLPDERWKSLVECQCCKGLFRRDQCNAHHLVEVGSLASTSPEDIQAYRDRMFVPHTQLAPWCHQCHQDHHRTT